MLSKKIKGQTQWPAQFGLYSAFDPSPVASLCSRAGGFQSIGSVLVPRWLFGPDGHQQSNLETSPTIVRAGRSGANKKM